MKAMDLVSTDLSSLSRQVNAFVMSSTYNLSSGRKGLHPCCSELTCQENSGLDLFFVPLPYLRRCMFANGDKYDGEWEKGLPHGFGTMLYCSGEWYTGQWQQGKRHGEGKATFFDGTKFKGMWEEDMWLQSATAPR
jgi:hypothetical protein